MKKIVSLLYVIGGLVFTSVQVEANFMNQIKTLEANNEYELARQVIGDNFDKNNSLQLMNMWMNLDASLFRNIKNESKISELTKFLPPEKLSTTEKALLAGGIVIGGAVTFFTGGLAGPAVAAIGGTSAALLIGGGAIIGGAVSGSISNQKNTEKNNKNFYLIDMHKAKDTISIYIILKSSQIHLQEKLKLYARTNTNEQVIDLLNKQKSFKINIKKSYQNYISYTVVSPYLAYADYHIYLSNDDWFGHDSNELNKAAKAMANGAYKDILLESKEEVKEQFYGVYQRLKETAGDKEWEDLKVLQSLVDSVSKKKRMGSDLWWE